MIDIIIPKELNIPMADNMPVIELAAKLYEKGYELVPEGQDIIAKPICKHGRLERVNGHWHCKCGAKFTDQDLESVNHLKSVAEEMIDHPAWDIPCNGCGQRKRQCVCSQDEE